MKLWVDSKSHEAAFDLLSTGVSGAGLQDHLAPDSAGDGLTVSPLQPPFNILSAKIAIDVF